MPVRVAVHVLQVDMALLRPDARTKQSTDGAPDMRRNSCAWPVSIDSATEAEPKLSTISRRVAASTSWMFSTTTSTPSSSPRFTTGASVW